MIIKNEVDILRSLLGRPWLMMILRRNAAAAGSHSLLRLLLLLPGRSLAHHLVNIHQILQLRDSRKQLLDPIQVDSSLRSCRISLVLLRLLSASVLMIHKLFYLDSNGLESFGLVELLCKNACLFIFQIDKYN